MTKQQEKLVNSLVLLVENIRNPDALKNLLSALGARHKGYGVIAQQYSLVGEVLIETFHEYLQEDFTPETQQAWLNTYQLISQIMLEGAGEVPTETPTPLVTQLETQPVPVISPTSPQVLSGDETQKTFKFDLGKKLKRFIHAVIQQFNKIKFYRIQPPHIRPQTQQLQNRLKNYLLKIVDWFWKAPTWLLGILVTITILFLIPQAEEGSLLAEILDYAETISIFLALVLYVKESPERRKEFHYNAWRIIDSAKDIKDSYARILAMQDLNDDGVALKSLNLVNANLSEIELNHANLSRAILNKANLSNAQLIDSNLDSAYLKGADISGANLEQATLSFAKLNGANLSNANLKNANLICANLTKTRLSGTDLRNANLSGANLKEAYLIGANLAGAQVMTIDLEKAFLTGATMPDGSIHN